MEKTHAMVVSLDTTTKIPCGKTLHKSLKKKKKLHKS